MAGLRGTAPSIGLWPDLALAVTLTVGGQLELLLSGVSGWHGLAHALLLAAQTVPVAVRRIAPVAAAAIGASALALEAVMTTPTNTLCGLLAGLVLIYSVGRWVAGVGLVMITCVMGLALGLHMLRLPGSEIVDLAFAAIFSAAAWLGGRTMRRREQEHRRADAELRHQQEDAANVLRAAVTDERARIARELHDVVAHGMGVMVVQAAAAEQMLAVDPEAAREPLANVRSTGQGALAEMRRLLGLLRDGDAVESAEPQPGLARLPVLVSGLRDNGMEVELTLCGDPPVLPEGLELTVYRIVQEALTNSLRHAGGASATVAVQYEHAQLDLRVANGPGAPTAASATGAGHGLVGMRERVRLYDGTLTAEPEPSGGFLVHATLPYPS